MIENYNFMGYVNNIRDFNHGWFNGENKYASQCAAKKHCLRQKPFTM